MKIKRFNEYNETNDVFFNKDVYPGFMYVKKILPKYKMYFVSYKEDKVFDTDLIKDDEIPYLYWLYSIDRDDKFGYEIDSESMILNCVDKEKMTKYCNKNFVFPTCSNIIKEK